METALAVNQAKYWHLKQMQVFKSLADWELKQLVNIADLRLVKAGTDLFRAGEMAHQLFVLRSGKVKLYRDLPGGKRVVLDFVGSGDLFGEDAVLGEGNRADSAEVVDDAFVCVIERDQFEGYVHQHPDLALHVGCVISRRRRRAEDLVGALLSQDVKTRLARTLVRLAAEHGDADEQGIRVDLRLTQTDLGQLVGSTRETTSMAFNAFRRDGLVEAKDRVIWVLDHEGLAAI